MASYVQHAKNILADKAPNFMSLNSINGECTPPPTNQPTNFKCAFLFIAEQNSPSLCFLCHPHAPRLPAPPIDFADAMKKAKVAVEGKVREVVGEGHHDSKIFLAAINRDARLTFSYLLMQLHARGGQTFWVSGADQRARTSSTTRTTTTHFLPAFIIHIP